MTTELDMVYCPYVVSRISKLPVTEVTSFCTNIVFKASAICRCLFILFMRINGLVDISDRFQGYWRDKYTYYVNELHYMQIYILLKRKLFVVKCWRAEKCKRLYEKNKQAVWIFRRYSEGQNFEDFIFKKFGRK